MDSIQANRHFEQENASEILLLGMALALSSLGAGAMRRTGLAGTERAPTFQQDELNLALFGELEKQHLAASWGKEKYVPILF